MVKNSSSADERNRATMKCKRHVIARLKLTWCFFVRFRPCPKHRVSGRFLRTLVWWMARTCKRFCLPTLEHCAHSARKVHEKFTERNRATMKCKRHVIARLKLTWCFFVRFRPCPKHRVSGRFLRTLVWWMARTCKRFCLPTLEHCAHSARKVHEKFTIALLKF